MQPSAWSSTILRTLGVSRVTVVNSESKLRVAGAACLLTAALAMAGFPSVAHAEGSQAQTPNDQIAFIGKQPSTSSIGQLNITSPSQPQSSSSARILAYEAMIDASGGLTAGEKLRAVNRFFNDHIQYQTDRQAWGKADYWATPMETLTKGAGDCEDFAIAKHHALQQLGIDPNSLKIVYVKSSKFSEPHMVLAYSAKPGADPQILDNIEKEISPLSKRNDLTPVYAFNESGLYLPGSDTLVAGPERLSKWQSLLAKMETEKPLIADAVKHKPLDLSMFSTGDLKTSSSIDSYMERSRAKADPRLDTDGPGFK